MVQATRSALEVPVGTSLIDFLSAPQPCVHNSIIEAPSIPSRSFTRPPYNQSQREAALRGEA